MQFIIHFLKNKGNFHYYCYFQKQSMFTLVCVCVCVTQSGLTLQPHQLHSPAGSSVHGILQARILRVGCHFLLQGIFPSLPHCRQIFYPLSHHTLEMWANADPQWVGSLKYAYLMLDLRLIPYNRKSCVCSMLHYLNSVFFFSKNSSDLSPGW